MNLGNSHPTCACHLQLHICQGARFERGGKRPLPGRSCVHSLRPAWRRRSLTFDQQSFGPSACTGWGDHAEPPGSTWSADLLRSRSITRWSALPADLLHLCSQLPEDGEHLGQHTHCVAGSPRAGGLPAELTCGLAEHANHASTCKQVCMKLQASFHRSSGLHAFFQVFP